MPYKFLDSQDVDKVLTDGTLMVSSLEYFRNLEASEGDIADRLEGASELTFRGGLVATENSKELEQLNAANSGIGQFDAFAKVSDGGRIVIGAGAKIVYTLPELFIFSYSEGEIATLKRAMCADAVRPYNACLRIRNPLELAKSCYFQGQIRNLNNRPVAELFEDAVFGDVQYVPRSIDLEEGGALAPDPLMKAEKFSHQSEARLIFIPREGVSIPQPRLVIAIPDPTAHFELVFRGLT